MADTVSGVTGSSPTTTTSTPGTVGSGLDKQAFLKLLVAQMSHQDPLAPTEGTEYVTQLAQFSLVEQSQNQSTQLTQLSTQLGGLSNNASTDLVGKMVNVRGHGVAWDGTNATGASVTLQGNATKVRVDIQDSSGKTVRTLDMGAHTAGTMAINWDGHDASGQPAIAGNYSVKVTATDPNGAAVSSTSDVTGTVKKVSFDKGYPELLLDSGATAPISDLVSVGGVTK